MASDFVPALDQEIAALEAELREDPRTIKLFELKRIRELYNRAAAVEFAARAAVDASQTETAAAAAAIVAASVAAANGQPAQEKFFVNRPRGL